MSGERKKVSKKTVLTMAKASYAGTVEHTSHLDQFKLPPWPTVFELCITL